MSTERFDPAYWTLERTAELLGIPDWAKIDATYQEIATEAQALDPGYPRSSEFWKCPNPRTMYGSPPALLARQHDDRLLNVNGRDTLDKGPNEVAVRDYVVTIFTAERIQRYLGVMQKDTPLSEIPRPTSYRSVSVELPNRSYRVTIQGTEDGTPVASHANNSGAHTPFSDTHQAHAQEVIIRLAQKHDQKRVDRTYHEERTAAKAFLGTIGIIGGTPRKERRFSQQRRARYDAIHGHTY